MPGNRFDCTIQKSQILWPLPRFSCEKSKLQFYKKQVLRDSIGVRGTSRKWTKKNWKKKN